MRRQNPVQRQSQSRRKLLFCYLASLVVGEEGREDPIAGLQGRHALAGLGDDSAHIRTGDDGVVLADGFMMGVFTHTDYTPLTPSA